MKALSITGLVLGVLAPLVMFFPLFGALAGDEGYLSVGWVLLLVTWPLGLLLTLIAGGLVVIAAALALRRGVGRRSVPITGIVLVSVGFLVELLTVAAAVTGSGEVAIVSSIVIGIGSSLAGLITCAVAGLRRRPGA